MTRFHLIVVALVVLAMIALLHRADSNSTTLPPRTPSGSGPELMTHYGAGRQRDSWILHVSVVDQDDKGVPGVALRSSRTQSSVTDERGGAELVLAVDSAVVDLDIPSGWVGPESIAVSSESPHATVIVTSTVKLRGRVTNEAGLPVGNAWVGVAPPDGRLGAAPEYTAKTADDGGFLVRLPSPWSRAWVTVRPPDGELLMTRSVLHTLTSDNALQVRLPQPAVLHIDVEGAVPGHPTTLYYSECVGDGLVPKRGRKVSVSREFALTVPRGEFKLLAASMDPAQSASRVQVVRVPCGRVVLTLRTGLAHTFQVPSGLAEDFELHWIAESGWKEACDLYPPKRWEAMHMLPHLEVRTGSPVSGTEIRVFGVPRRGGHFFATQKSGELCSLVENLNGPVRNPFQSLVQGTRVRGSLVPWKEPRLVDVVLSGSTFFTKVPVDPSGSFESPPLPTGARMRVGWIDSGPDESVGTFPGAYRVVSDLHVEVPEDW